MSNKIKHSFMALIIVISLIVVLVIGFTLGYRYVISQNQRFSRYDTHDIAVDDNKLQNDKIIITQDTEGAVMIYVDYGDRTSDIAKKLVKNNLIKHPTLFTLMSKINGFDGGYQYGTHFVKPDMTYDEIMYNLTLRPSSSQITFREGLTYRQIKDILRSEGVQFNEREMDDMINFPNKYFKGYDLLAKIKPNPGRDWILQGYLFPDTYSFDLNTNSQTIIQTFISNAERRIRPEYYERAAKMNMSMDQVLTLASIIQMESGNIQEMYKISRVFHNRLAKKTPLQSCATINYYRSEQNLPRLLVISESDLQLDTPYNSYRNTDLPPGPICNPGLEAIRAALYPSNDPADKNLMFFAATGEGNNVFANTFEEHLVNVRKYVLPLAQEQGFHGDIDHTTGAIYSRGGTIVAPTN